MLTFWQDTVHPRGDIGLFQCWKGVYMAAEVSFHLIMPFFPKISQNNDNSILIIIIIIIAQ